MKHTNLLRDVKPTELGPWGVALEAKEEKSSTPPVTAKDGAEAR